MPSTVPSHPGGFRSPAGIDYFGRGHWLSRIQAHISYGARHRMFQIWKRYAGEIRGKSILDVGTTPDLERQDSNCMIPWFQNEGVNVFLYSPEDISGLASIFPGTTILSTNGFGQPIRASDQSFDWATASAVLEHVGSSDDQVNFIRECARVSDGLFLTTPNRGHWLEFHTKLPLLHWLPRATHRRILRGLGKRNWALESHLRLVGHSELGALARLALGKEFDLTIGEIWTLGMPSNLILLARRKSAAVARSSATHTSIGSVDLPASR